MRAVRRLFGTASLTLAKFMPLTLIGWGLPIIKVIGVGDTCTACLAKDGASAVDPLMYATHSSRSLSPESRRSAAAVKTVKLSPPPMR